MWYEIENMTTPEEGFEAMQFSQQHWLPPVHSFRSGPADNMLSFVKRGIDNFSNFTVKCKI